jgi:predicted TIM-barrel fold metal-dependent hydrolase
VFKEGARADCACCTSRRGFLASVVGGAAVAAGAGGALGAQPARARQVIDVHSHYMPPALRTMGPPVGPMAGWSLQRHLDDMAQAGVARAILSITTPGVPVKGEQGRGLIRAANEYGARLRDDNRAKLGFFTYVRLDDLDASLKEIAYGFDTLKAHGVGLFTSYDGKWLGDPMFDPIFEELNRRRAIVYVHPTTAACCGQLIPGLADTLIEYGTDTTRAIASYIYRGAARKFPNVQMIWSHSGGSMPYLIERFDGADNTPALRQAAPEGFRAAAGRFFYDVAQASNPVATGALRKVVPPGQIVFGTDYPFRTPLEHVQSLEKGGVFSDAELTQLYRGNVARGMPGLLA